MQRHFPSFAATELVPDRVRSGGCDVLVVQLKIIVICACAMVFWMMINVYFKMVVRKPTYKKRWSEFQGCCMYVIVRVCEPLLFFATKPGSSAKQHRLNNYDIDCVIIWDAGGV